MNVERLLQVSMAALITLGTLLLGMGERNMLLPLLALIVAVSSVYLTDVKGWLQLNTTLANLAAIAALWLSVRDLDALHSERQLISMANLLIYLQFVLMYRKKTVRGYWMLALLSLLQVAVAAALNLSIVFGFLLLLYMFIGLFTLALFFIHREAAVHHASAAASGDEPIVAEAGRRWPLAGVPAGFSSNASAGAEQAGLVWALFRQVGRLSMVSLLLAVVVFFALPRLGSTDGWRTRPGGAYRVIGFSESVTLGELGEAYENPGEVMQVELFDYFTGDPYRLGDQPLFRGALLQKYHRGRWSRRGGHGEKQRMRISEHLPANEELVRQVVRAAPLDDDTLFCIPPSFLVSPDYESNKHLRYSERTEQILRSDEADNQMLKLELVTAGLRDHFTSSVSIATRKPSEEELKQMLELPAEQDGRDPLVGLKAVALQRVRPHPTANRERQAQLLTGYLRDSGRYSLSPVSREKTLDPVEDFVTRNLVGHCEYFASALTLMLRSVGIPARMAVGFKGGDWNNVGHFYQVRQLHAHTWVEAYLEDIDDLPARLHDSPMARTNGAWLTLDPTPATVEEEPGFGEYAFNQLADFSQYIWSNYVMGMDAQRQHEDIYQPVMQSIEAVLERLADPQGRREIVRQMLGKPDPRGWTWTDGWFHWRAMIVVVVGLLLVVFACRALRWTTRALVSIVRRRRLHAARQDAGRVHFYCRFEELLARHGWSRPATQTQYEFAVAAGGQLAESPLTQQAAALPRRIVEAFYRVRFGNASLDNAETAAVEQAVSELAGALDQKANGG